MDITINKVKLKGTASSEIDDFKVSYAYEYEEGVAPDAIRARATREDSQLVFDVNLYLSNGNINSTVHYAERNTDLSLITKIVDQMYSIADSITNK